ncbi:MAG: sugar ABC transporter permease, partial [Clostridia bacterium]|nr:sugar ABC transporter permease [Clostridia bacterium]
MGHMISVGFEKVFLLQNPLNLETSTVLSTFVYQKGLIDGQISFSTAVDVFSSAISILMVVFFNGLSRKFTETSLW